MTAPQLVLAIVAPRFGAAHESVPLALIALTRSIELMPGVEGALDTD